MRLIISWGKENKRPIPFKTIVQELSGVPDVTTKASVKSLVRKGFLRKAVLNGYGSTSAYIQLRSI